MIGRVVAVGYVVVVAGLATVGFAADSTGAILAAGALALPASVPAVVAYYLVYGLLGQVPGANPDSAGGYESCTSDGLCHGSETGQLATWFALTTDAFGILAVTAGAALNVAVACRLLRGRRAASARTRSGA